MELLQEGWSCPFTFSNFIQTFLLWAISQWSPEVTISGWALSGFLQNLTSFRGVAEMRPLSKCLLLPGGLNTTIFCSGILLLSRTFCWRLSGAHSAALPSPSFLTVVSCHSRDWRPGKPFLKKGLGNTEDKSTSDQLLGGLKENLWTPVCVLDWAAGLGCSAVTKIP